MLPYTHPQIPRELPESRHRSRVEEPQTAPERQRRLDHADSLAIRRRRRSQGPQGMRETGFEGLFGGIENTDSEALH